MFTFLRRLVIFDGGRTPEEGQTTAEYALIILGAAAIATLVITWATQSHAVSRLFDIVIDRIIP